MNPAAAVREPKLVVAIGKTPALHGPEWPKSFHCAATIAASLDFSVCPNGAVHQWRKNPPRKLSVGPGS